MANRDLTSAEICESFGFSGKTLDRYCADGLQFDQSSKRGKPRLFSESEVEKFMRDRNLTGEKGRASEGGSDELTAVKTQKEIQLAERYAIENNREDLKFIDAGTERERQRGASEYVATVMAKLPAQMIGAIDGLSGADAHQAFDAVIVGTLEQIRDQIAA